MEYTSINPHITPNNADSPSSTVNVARAAMCRVAYSGPCSTFPPEKRPKNLRHHPCFSGSGNLSSSLNKLATAPSP